MSNQSDNCHRETTMSRKYNPPMTGFLNHDPHDPDPYPPIELHAILSALHATSVVLHDTENFSDVERIEGLSSAIRVLVELLRQRDTGAEVVCKRARSPRSPSPPKARKTKAPVVSLVARAASA